ncbi:hypothetical protein IWX84_002010 [Flavobacterium sp. CG_9.10]|uniref:T9SS type A sorting domain-containing protein n=1 Tax=Flavobacterium sp. CG_9.10 TaxID=2787729 RepID=UPI0018C9D352|nr:T9SS type A sorting domain-containing protein [Flavobacterium sp. CG_9.10]MBG6111126.1 hypothetical protein [Flavobacterium sp. CG_9.10]
MKTQTTLQWRKINLFKSVIVWICFLFAVISSAQKVESVLNENWINGNWQNALSTSNTYDGNNFLINSLSQTWSASSGTWINAYQQKLNNNSDGSLNQATGQTWDMGTSLWNDTVRSSYIYNPAMKALTFLSEIWAGTWQNSQLETNTYDSNNFLIHTLSQTWDLTNSRWKNYVQTNFINNADGTINQSITQNRYLDIWENSSQTNFIYDANGTLHQTITLTQQPWDYDDIWYNNIRVTTSYDGSNHITNSLSQIWDAASSSWINNFKSDYSNDGNGNPIQIIMQSWDTRTNLWNNSHRITFNYTLGLSDLAKGINLTLYPNPAVDIITVKSNSDLYEKSYLISDQNGKIIQTGTLNSEITIVNLSKLCSGMYFFRMNEQPKQSIKIMKK